MDAIEGIFVPNIVPYDAQGRINEDELRRIIRWLVGKGVSGFYPNGSMGEFIRLSYEERKRVLKIVAEEAAGKPILAGAAEPNVDLVLEMCRYCADLGCRAVSITGPYYYKLRQESIEQYFREIAAKSPIDARHQRGRISPAVKFIQTPRSATASCCSIDSFRKNGWSHTMRFAPRPLAHFATIIISLNEM